MKTKALALTVLTLSTCANAATIYDKDDTNLSVGGRVQSVFYNTNAAKKNELNHGNDNTLVNSARLSVQGSTKINSYVKAFAFTEWDMADGNQNDKVTAREQYVGLDFGRYGQIAAGRTYSAIKSVIETTDIFEDFGCAGQYGEDDFRSGTIRYTFDNGAYFASLSANLASDGQPVEGVESDEFDADGKVNIKSGFSAVIGYTTPEFLLGPVSFKAGYEYLRINDSAAKYSVPESLGLDFDVSGIEIFAPAVNNVKSVAASVKWGGDEGLSLGALFNTRKITLNSNFIKESNELLEADEAMSYRLIGCEFVAAYGFDNGLSVAAGYEFSEIKGDHAGNSAIFRRIPVYVNYSLNENFNVWTEAQFNAGDEHKNSDLTKTLFSVGARYTF